MPLVQVQKCPLTFHNSSISFVMTLWHDGVLQQHTQKSNISLTWQNISLFQCRHTANIRNWFVVWNFGHRKCCIWISVHPHYKQMKSCKHFWNTQQMCTEGCSIKHLKSINRQQIVINTTKEMYLKTFCRWLQMANHQADVLLS